MKVHSKKKVGISGTEDKGKMPDEIFSTEATKDDIGVMDTYKVMTPCQTFPKCFMCINFHHNLMCQVLLISTFYR